MSFSLIRMSEKPQLKRACVGRMIASISLLVVFAVVGQNFVPSAALAQVPHDMTYQGQLTDSVGAPLSGAVDVELRIFEVLSGGAALYAESHSGISLDDEGGFGVQLGAGTSSIGTFGPALFSGVNRYLEVVVDGEVFTPRQVLASVPWALVAEDVFFDPTNNIGTAITDAQDTADDALLDAAAAAAGHTVDTTLNEAEVDAFVANNGYSTGAHTTNTDTQLTNSQVRDAALAQGFVMGAHATDTKLNESQVDAYVANNGYSTGAHTTNTDTQLTNSQVRDAALAQGFVMGAHTTDTKLNESQVDAYVANNGYSTGAHTTNTDTQLTNSQVRDAALAQGFVTGAHTTNTTLNESQVDAFVANNGYSTGAHTTNTDTQLTNSQVRNAALAQGFFTGAHTTNTTLNEAQVDAYVADNGYAMQSYVEAGLVAGAALMGAHLSNLYPDYNHNSLRNIGNLYSSADVTAGDDLIANDDITAGDGVWAQRYLYSSDRRLKTNIEPIDDALDVVKDLRGVTFHRLDQGDGEPLRYGFIAQEVLEVVPDLVVLDSEGEYYSIDYVGFVGLLTVAIQEQSDQIAALEAQNEKLLRAKRSFSHRLKRIEDRLSGALD